jgi:bacterial/archaeal transporter family protein
MGWMTYVVGAAAALAAADVFVKLAAGRVPSSLGMLLYGAVAFGIGVVWTVLDRTSPDPVRASTAGIVYALAVGVSFSAVTFGLYGAFTAGAPLSVTSPVVRLGGLIVASACGVFIWSEPVTVRYATGVTLAIVGVYLIATR